MSRSLHLGEIIEGGLEIERTFHRRRKQQKQKVVIVLEITIFMVEGPTNRPLKDYVALTIFTGITHPTTGDIGLCHSRCSSPPPISSHSQGYNKGHSKYVVIYMGIIRESLPQQILSLHFKANGVMDKPLEKGIVIIEVWLGERGNTSRRVVVRGKYEVNNVELLLAKFDALSQKFNKL
ncbi:hypothetical protein CR513_20164, partial [Mucuna pruriens]